MYYPSLHKPYFLLTLKTFLVVLLPKSMSTLSCNNCQIYVDWLLDTKLISLPWRHWAKCSDKVSNTMSMNTLKIIITTIIIVCHFKHEKLLKYLLAIFVILMNVTSFNNAVSIMHFKKFFSL